MFDGLSHVLLETLAAFGCLALAQKIWALNGYAKRYGPIGAGLAIACCLNLAHITFSAAPDAALSIPFTWGIESALLLCFYAMPRLSAAHLVLATAALGSGAMWLGSLEVADWFVLRESWPFRPFDAALCFGWLVLIVRAAIPSLNQKDWLLMSLLPLSRFAASLIMCFSKGDDLAFFLAHVAKTTGLWLEFGLLAYLAGVHYVRQTEENSLLHVDRPPFRVAVKRKEKGRRRSRLRRP